MKIVVGFFNNWGWGCSVSLHTPLFVTLKDSTKKGKSGKERRSPT